MSRKPIRTIENADPREQNNPVPRVVLALVAGLVIWAVSYIVLQRANGPAELGDRRDPVALPATTQAGAASGAEIFVRCQVCHQASWQGLPGVFPPLAGSPWGLGVPSVTVQILLHGLTGPVGVLGATYNGVMPSFGDQLDDAEIAAVLTYVRDQWGNGASRLDRDFIAAERKRSAQRKDSWQGTDQIAAFLSAGAGGAAHP